MSFSCRITVFFFSAARTFRYSQDLQAKKYAPIASSMVATWVSENLILASSRRTTAGRAFCCFFFGSSFLKDRRSLDRNLPSSPSLSLEGFGRLFSRKVCATCVMVFQTVLSTKVPRVLGEKRPWRRAIAKAPSSLIFWFGGKELRKRTSLRPTSSHHSFHLFHARAWSSCVALVTAVSAEVSAAAM